MIQSPDGNRATGFLPKSITTSMSSRISSFRASSLRILGGTSSRNSSSSSWTAAAAVEAPPSDLDRVGTEPWWLQREQRSASGRRMDGATALRGPGEWRNDEEEQTMRLGLCVWSCEKAFTWEEEAEAKAFNISRLRLLLFFVSVVVLIVSLRFFVERVERGRSRRRKDREGIGGRKMRRNL
ncbi:hypothetical protein B296_00028457 [Ensete ventricosum]|uniref:Uncharacterized protein n=1 Tax=Ensete ventricosum TaxID=4639 RepID=A0A427AMS3_ENSVE|nr:hypothetical protein B296_00028457 [Ensete ventricosum]